MNAATRKEVSINDLQAVLDAAKLLASYGLMSGRKAKEIGLAVREDCDVQMERWDDFERQSLINQVRRQTPTK